MALVSPTANMAGLLEAARADVDTFFHLTLDLLTICTIDGYFKKVNPAWTEVLGYETDELVGQPFASFVHPDDLGATAAEVSSLMEGVPTVAFENRYRCQDGSYRSFLWNCAALPEKGLLYAVARDVTDRNRADQELQQMAAIIRSSGEAIVGMTLDGIITSWNPAAQRMYGYCAEEVVGTSIELISPEGHTGDCGALLTDIRAGQHVEHLESVRIRKDGTPVTVTLSASPIHDTAGAVIGVATITHHATRAWRAFESARSMIESSLDSLVAISPEGMITDVNEATVKVTGIPRDQLIGTAFSDYFTEPEKADRIYQLVFDDGMAVDYALTMRHRDGTLTEVLYNASVHRDAEGTVLGVFAAARDVTKQMKAQYARSLFEAGLDPLVTISPGGKITDVNQATVTVTGMPREELIGTDFSDYFTEPERAGEGYQLVFAQGSVTDYPLTMRHRDGTLTEVLYNASLFRDTTGNVLGVFAAARDVTEQKQAQAELAKAAKELDRLADLERFQRLTIGRELKMIELKKEIEYLKRLVPAEEGEFRGGERPPP